MRACWHPNHAHPSRCYILADKEGLKHRRMLSCARCFQGIHNLHALEPAVSVGHWQQVARQKCMDYRAAMAGPSLFFQTLGINAS